MPRRPRSRRRKNPSTLAWAAIGTAAALTAAGITAYVVSRRERIDDDDAMDGWVDTAELDGSVYLDGEYVDEDGDVVVQETVCMGPGGGPPCIRTTKKSPTKSAPNVPARGPGQTPLFLIGQASLKPPKPVDQSGAPIPSGTSKPTGSGKGTPTPIGPGKEAIVRLPAPQTFGGWKFVKSWGPFRGNAYSLYMEHGIKGWRWALTGYGSAAGKSAKHWTTRDTADAQVRQVLKIAFGRASDTTLNTISTKTVLFENTWGKTS